ncbi:MAG: hypothetical protein ISEC1_P1292 [Thiomicrorhabdus sp.]|nr:MAG: hypothetical protein ISEC1_P1292 [Thiomicrorhabdus sp.]
MQTSNFSIPINEMLQMQATLNDATNGPGWRSGVTQLGKLINWQRCIYMEAAELIDSYPWKHWKSIDAKVDEENARVELVDIWHFLLSLVLEKLSSDQALALLDKALQANDAQQTELNGQMNVMSQVAVHEVMLKTALESAGEMGSDSAAYLTRLADSFFSACKVADLDFDQLYKIYMAKNVLNKFRQDNGYKEGTYIKEWNGVEDNVVMFEIMRELKVFYGHELYELLDEQYKKHGFS